MSLSRTVLGSAFQMAGAVQRKAHFAIVVSAPLLEDMRW